MTPNLCMAVAGISLLFLLSALINKDWKVAACSGAVLLIALAVFLWDLFAYRRHLGKQDQPYRFDDDL